MIPKKRSFTTWFGVPPPNKRMRSPIVATRPTETPGLDDSKSLSSDSSSTSSTNLKPIRENTKVAGYAALSTLKGSMRMLQKSCKVFPPLYSVAETLLEVLDSIESITKDDSELLQMASELPQWTVILSSYLSNSCSEEQFQLARTLAVDIQRQADNLKKYQQCTIAKQRILDPQQTAVQLKQCYHCIQTSFRQLQADTSLTTWRITHDHWQGSKLNELLPSHNARYDSVFAQKVERCECLRNTRVRVLDIIRRWIYSSGDTNIYWINGMAGTGKTTIAFTICLELEQRGQLGASFFCSRAASDCRDLSRLFPTIAYQLAQKFYPFRSALCRILNNADSSICQRNLSVQYERLIREPLMEAGDMLPKGIIIVIDALDELAALGASESVLHTLRYAADLPVRFFLTSRPDSFIPNVPQGCNDQPSSVLHLHNIEEHLVKADIETYLTVSLSKISLTDDQIKQLAEQAGVLFIYAATVAKYVLAGRLGANTSARLTAVLSKDTNTQSNKKYQEIDRLYKTIIDRVLHDDQLEESEVDLIRRVLWTVVCVREPVTKGTLAALLNVDKSQVSIALQPLQSVLHVMEDSEVISTLHASFPDFILNAKRSGPQLCCDEPTQSKHLATRCFEIMEMQLRFNICDLETSYLYDYQVIDLDKRIDDSISVELFYACRYWSQHLSRSKLCDRILSRLDNFLHKHLLFWMEVLNLRRQLGKGASSLTEVHDWLLRDHEISEIMTFTSDARAFLVDLTTNPVCLSTPHIYISGLPLVSKKNKVWQAYWERTQGLLRVDGTLQSRRHKAAPTHSWTAYKDKIPSTELRSHPFEGHTTSVTSVTFSPDGKLIASGSRDRTLRLWDSRSGVPSIGPFEGHTSWVTSVAFSQDGTRIVSGTWDKEIRVWDVHSGGLLIGPLKGHKDTITSVVFSPDGTRIVSGSDDQTIRVWNSETGKPILSSLEGHTDSVRAVAISPDGTRIASGSQDCTVRVWDMRSGKLLAGPIEGHTDRVTSVAFSPDSASIVSGSDDCTVQLWDSRTSSQLDKPFIGHTGLVTSVAFSPDGTLVVSGSEDCTIRVWDIRARLFKPLEGHESSVTSVAFSSDGARVVSASLDGTIMVWDLENPHSQSLTSGSWYIDDENGWVMDDRLQVPLIWLPPELHDVFPRPPNSTLIRPDGSIGVSWNDTLLLGESWHQCYKTSGVEPT